MGLDKGLTSFTNLPGLLVLKASVGQGDTGRAMALSQWSDPPIASTPSLGRVGAPSQVLSVGGQKILRGNRTVERRSGTTSLQLILGLDYM